MTHQEWRRLQAEARRHPQISAGPRAQAPYSGPPSDWTPGIVRTDDERSGT